MGKNVSDRRSEKEIHAERKGIVIRKPIPYDPVDFRKRKRNKPRMESQEQCRKEQERADTKKSFQFGKRCHEKRDQHISENFKRGKPKRTVPFYREKRHRMPAGNEKQSGKKSGEWSASKITKQKRNEEARGKRYVKSRGDTKKPIQRIRFETRKRISFPDGIPKRKRMERSGKQKKYHHDAWQRFHELVKAPRQCRKVLNRSMLVQMVCHYRKASYCPETGHTMERFGRDGHNSPNIGKLTLSQVLPPFRYGACAGTCPSATRP